MKSSLSVSAAPLPAARAVAGGAGAPSSSLRHAAAVGHHGAAASAAAEDDGPGSRSPADDADANNWVIVECLLRDALQKTAPRFLVPNLIQLVSSISRAGPIAGLAFANAAVEYTQDRAWRSSDGRDSFPFFDVDLLSQTFAHGRLLPAEVDARTLPADDMRLARLDFTVNKQALMGRGLARALGFVAAEGPAAPSVVSRWTPFRPAACLPMLCKGTRTALLPQRVVGDAPAIRAAAEAWRQDLADALNLRSLWPLMVQHMKASIVLLAYSQGVSDSDTGDWASLPAEGEDCTALQEVVACDDTAELDKLAEAAACVAARLPLPERLGALITEALDDPMLVALLRQEEQDTFNGSYALRAWPAIAAEDAAAARGCGGRASGSAAADSSVTVLAAWLEANPGKALCLRARLVAAAEARLQMLTGASAKTAAAAAAAGATGTGSAPCRRGHPSAASARSTVMVGASAAVGGAGRHTVTDAGGAAEDDGGHWHRAGSDDDDDTTRSDWAPRTGGIRVAVVDRCERGGASAIAIGSADFASRLQRQWDDLRPQQWRLPAWMRSAHAHAVVTHVPHLVPPIDIGLCFVPVNGRVLAERLKPARGAAAASAAAEVATLRNIIKPCLHGQDAEAATDAETDGVTLRIRYQLASGVFNLRLDDPAAPSQWVVPLADETATAVSEMRTLPATRHQIGQVNALPAHCRIWNAPHLREEKPRLIGVTCATRPGSADMVTCTEQTYMGTTLRHKLSYAQFAHQAQLLRRESQARAWSMAVARHFTGAGVSRSTASVDGLARFQTVLAAHYQDASQEFLKPRWAHARFEAQLAVHRSLEAFWMSVMAGGLFSLHHLPTEECPSPNPADAAHVVIAASSAELHPEVVRAGLVVCGGPAYFHLQDDHRCAETHAACGSLLQRVRYTAVDTYVQRGEVTATGLRGAGRSIVAGDIVPGTGGQGRCPKCGKFVNTEVNTADNVRDAYTRRLACAIAGADDVTPLPHLERRARPDETTPADFISKEMKRR